jgi:hypothetical protein
MDHCRGAFSRLAALRLLAIAVLFLVAAPCQPRKFAHDNGPLFTTGHTSPWLGIYASLLSFLVFNFFFTEP